MGICEMCGDYTTPLTRDLGYEIKFYLCYNCYWEYEQVKEFHQNNQATIIDEQITGIWTGKWE